MSDNPIADAVVSAGLKEIEEKDIRKAAQDYLELRERIEEISQDIASLEAERKHARGLVNDAAMKLLNIKGSGSILTVVRAADNDGVVVINHTTSVVMGAEVI